MDNQGRACSPVRDEAWERYLGPGCASLAGRNGNKGGLGCWDGLGRAREGSRANLGLQLASRTPIKIGLD